MTFWLYIATIPIAAVAGIGALITYCSHYPHSLNTAERRELAGVITLAAFVWPPVLGALLFIATMVGIAKGAGLLLSHFQVFKDHGTPKPKPSCRCVGGVDPCPLPPKEGVHR